MADDDDDHSTHPDQTDHRALAILLALVASVCLGFSQVSQRWLLSPAAAPGSACATTTSATTIKMPASSARTSTSPTRAGARRRNGERDQILSVFPWLGWATSGLIGLGELGLVASMIVAALRKRPLWIISPTTIALLPLMVAMITGCLFCATKPGKASFVGVAIGFWVFGTSEICSIIAALLLSRAIRPHDQDLAAGAMNPDEF